MRRMGILTIATMAMVFFGMAGMAQEENVQIRTGSHTVASPAFTTLVPIEDFRQQKTLLQTDLASREVTLGTAIINSFGGPFRNVSFFNARSELVNANNTYISSAFTRRNGLRIPLTSSLNFVLQIERWPNCGGVTPQLIRFRNRGAASVGVEMQLDGNPFSRRWWQ